MYGWKCQGKRKCAFLSVWRSLKHNIISFPFLANKKFLPPPCYSLEHETSSLKQIVYQDFQRFCFWLLKLPLVGGGKHFQSPNKTWEYLHHHMKLNYFKSQTVHSFEIVLQCYSSSSQIVDQDPLVNQDQLMGFGGSTKGDGKIK